MITYIVISASDSALLTPSEDSVVIFVPDYRLLGCHNTGYADYKRRFLAFALGAYVDEFTSTTTDAGDWFWRGNHEYAATLKWFYFVTANSPGHALRWRRFLYDGYRAA